MAELTVMELKACRQKLSEAVQAIRDEKFQALDSGKINLREFREIRDEQLELESLENRLTILVMDLQLDFLLNTDVDDSPGSRIVAATDKLVAAAKKLEEFDKFLQITAQIINLFSAIIIGVSAPSVASISGILASIDALVE